MAERSAEFDAATAELEAAFGLLMVQHRRTVQRQAEEISPGLTLGAMKTFSTVCHHGTITPSALAITLLLDRAQVSRMIRELEELGLVVRSPDPDDRRSTLISATPEGRARLERARGGPSEDGLRRALADWDPADIRALAGLLRRFTGGVTG